jgi:L-cysteine S-thiosulfotransferase
LLRKPSITISTRHILVPLILLALTVAACSKRQEQGPQPKRTAEWNSEALGETLFNERCLDCHKINGKGGETAPDLSKIGAKRDRPYLEEVIKEPSKVYPGTVMPSGNTLSAKQITSLVDYLSKQK